MRYFVFCICSSQKRSEFGACDQKSPAGRLQESVADHGLLPMLFVVQGRPTVVTPGLALFALVFGATE